MRFPQVIASGLALLLSSAVLAHPGHDVTKEVAERRKFLSSQKRTNLGHCAEKLRAREFEKRNVARRHAAVLRARAEKGITKRDLGTVLETSHNATSQDQEGIPLLLDYQVINVDTCEPVPSVYVEQWHCNSTGVYSGIVAGGNGNKNDFSNINNTFLRAIQETDVDGVAQFETIFPGHYISRANHIHIVVHAANSTVFSNGTLGNVVSSSHVGQGFFDQDLITEVEKFAPYASNWQPLTLNADDNVLQGETCTDGIDPMYECTLLGDSVEEGLFGWLAFGINTTQSQNLSPAAFYYEGGGVSNPDTPTGPPGGHGAPPRTPHQLP
ncbi:Intradiol ring-cleavage dioxygenase-like protein [Xylariales sp. AK1849]|nr:Intradiol ring-cleavage dioxygenase-like protein [Xylariales sp. AK1849]